MLKKLVSGIWFYRFAIWAFRTWAKLFLGLRITGTDNVPREGGLVVACNHFSSLDPPVVGVSVPREIHFMAKKELFANPAMAVLMHGLRTFPVDRGRNDTSSIRTAMRKLRSGLAVGIFIQGTRNAGEAAALNGAAFLAQRSGAGLLPTAVWREGRAFRVHFAEPLVLEPDLTARELTAVLTSAINAHLPADRRMGPVNVASDS